MTHFVLDRNRLIHLLCDMSRFDHSIYFQVLLVFIGCVMNPIGIWKMNQRTKKSIFNYLTMVLFASEFGYSLFGGAGFLIRGFCVSTFKIDFSEFMKILLFLSMGLEIFVGFDSKLMLNLYDRYRVFVRLCAAHQHIVRVCTQCAQGYFRKSVRVG